MAGYTEAFILGFCFFGSGGFCDEVRVEILPADFFVKGIPKLCGMK